MKFLQLTNKVPYPPRDGGAIASLTLARELAAAGHDVTMLAMNTSKHFLAEPKIPDVSFSLITVPVDTTIRFSAALRNILFSRLPYNAVRFVSEVFREKLREILRQEKFDYIILDQVYTALYLDDIRAITTTPLILRAHNIEHEIWSRAARSEQGFKRFYFGILARRIRRYEQSVMNRYDILVPITSRDAGHFMNMGNRRPCHVLPAGMDLPELPAGSAEPFVPSVAHLGALDWLPNRNGIKWFVTMVWPLVREKIPGIEFHLAGRNAPAGFAAEIAAPGVIYHGEIEHAGEFLRQHPVFIVPVFSGSGMRIKMLDYMAAGRATVSTTIGAEGIPVVSGSEAFITDRPEEFASSIVKLAADPGLCRSIGENARSFVGQNFDNRVLTTRFTEFLKTVDHSS